jgi:hypothetical protein
MEESVVWNLLSGSLTNRYARVWGIEEEQFWICSVSAKILWFLLELPRHFKWRCRLTPPLTHTCYHGFQGFQDMRFRDPSWLLTVEVEWLPQNLYSAIQMHFIVFLLWHSTRRATSKGRSRAHPAQNFQGDSRYRVRWIVNNRTVHTFERTWCGVSQWRSFLARLLVLEDLLRVTSQGSCFVSSSTRVTLGSNR